MSHELWHVYPRISPGPWEPKDWATNPARSAPKSTPLTRLVDMFSVLLNNRQSRGLGFGPSLYREPQLDSSTRKIRGSGETTEKVRRRRHDDYASETGYPQELVSVQSMPTMRPQNRYPLSPVSAMLRTNAR